RTATVRGSSPRKTRGISAWQKKAVSQFLSIADPVADARFLDRRLWPIVIRYTKPGQDKPRASHSELNRSLRSSSPKAGHGTRKSTTLTFAGQNWKCGPVGKGRVVGARECPTPEGVSSDPAWSGSAEESWRREESSDRSRPSVRTEAGKAKACDGRLGRT